MKLDLQEGMEQKEFQITSKRFEKRQQADAARKLRTGTVGDHELLRDYPALIHARGEIEGRTFQKIKAVFYDTRLWMLIPSEEKNNALRATAHLAFSNVGHKLEQKLGGPHSDPPWTLL